MEGKKNTFHLRSCHEAAEQCYLAMPPEDSVQMVIVSIYWNAK